MASIYNFIFPKYVTKNAQANILKYKYVGCDNSFLASLLQPFWRTAVNWLPMWMAPNLVTLVGFFFIIFGYLVNLYYLPLMKVSSGGVDPPSWIYVFNALCIFIYQTMDSLDGKQARRTNSSSGLGELFDHGCDSLTTFFVVHSFLASLQMGISVNTVGAIMIIIAAFYMAQWEQYHTDVMTLGYFGPTESQYSMIIGHLLTWYYGPSFWTQTVQLPVFGGLKLPVNELLILVTVIGALVAVLMNGYGVLRHGNKPLILCINQIIPLLVLVYTSIYWALKYPEILIDTPHQFMALFGFLGSFITCRLIVSRICQDSVPIFQNIFLPLLLVYIPTTIKLPFSQSTFIHYYFLFVFVIFFHFCKVVIDTLCNVLGIKCFTLTKKNK